jgi:uncharacterized protein (DUF427 family)
MWRNRPTPVRPEPGQESVWDYPRPPLVEEVEHRFEIVLGGVAIVQVDHALRVLETSHPPTYYFSVHEFLPGSLLPCPGETVCEWKGVAAYFDVVGGPAVVERAAWHFPEPRPGFEQLAGHVAVYPGRMDHCTVDDEVVTPQPGGFYGGWVTSRVTGPFKGVVGSQAW